MFSQFHDLVNELRREALEGIRQPSKIREDLKLIVYQGANLVEQAQAALDEVRGVKACQPPTIEIKTMEEAA